MAKNLFTKSSLQRHKEERSVVRNVTQSNLEEFAPGATDDVWSNDPLGTGLKSTQQLLVDWSDWKEHVFFNSAEAKVNLSFEQIINGYPFDGTSSEKSRYVAGLGGFQKYILDQFDTHKGYFAFDGNVFLQVEDQTGFAAPDLAKRFGEAKATENFHTSGSTHEFWIYIKSDEAANHENETRIVYQKRDKVSTNKAVSVWSQGVSANTDDGYTVSFHISSDAFKSLKHTITSIEYNKWHHVAFVYERATSERIYGYVNGVYNSNTAGNQSELDDIIMGDSVIYLGSGNTLNFTTHAANITAVNFKGLIDEFRIWSNTRTPSQIKSHMHKNVDSQIGLQLCYRFSEPSASSNAYQASSIVLDYSGNSLHTFIQNAGSFDPKALVNDISGDPISTPLENEKLSDNYILFPDWPPNAALNTSLLQGANQYVRNTPKIITKLVHPNYFMKAQ